MSEVLSSGIIKTNTIIDVAGANLASPDRMDYYTPGTGANQCMEGHFISGFVYNKKYHVELVLRWTGLTTNASSSFAATFQGQQYDSSKGSWGWTMSNPMTAAIQSACNLKTTVLSASEGLKYISTDFTNTNSNGTGYALGCRMDNSNGTGGVKIYKVLVVPYEYYIAGYKGSDTKCNIFNTTIAANEIYEI